MQDAFRPLRSQFSGKHVAPGVQGCGVESSDLCLLRRSM